MNLLDNAVMISLSFARFGNSRQIKANDGDNGVQCREIDPRVIRISKTLVDSPEIAAITKFDAGVREYVVSQSVPSFSLSGVFFLNKSIVADVDKKLTELAIQRSALIDAAADTLAQRIEETRLLLGPAFNSADYPTDAAFRDSYDISWSFLDLAVPESLKETNPEIYENEKIKAEHRLQNAQEQIKALLRQQFGEHIKKFVDRLEGKRENGKVKIFRDSMVENLNDFIGSFNARNLTGDNELADLVAEIRDVMDGVSADDLREVEELRDNVLAACKDVAARLEQLVATTEAPALKEAA